MGYFYTLTKAGFALQAKLFAEGGNLAITRVAVGSGILSEDADPTLLTNLVQARAKATSTAPIRHDCVVDFEIEYRSDLNPGLADAFLINEFGVFALGADGTEALILYGDLSKYPETAVPQMYGGCVRRYPVHLEIGPKAGAYLDYPAGAWATHQDLAKMVREFAVRQLDIAITPAGWISDVLGRYNVRLDVAVAGVTAKLIPCLTISVEGEEEAASCGLCPVVETLDGTVRLRAVTPPGGEFSASLTLLRDSSGIVLGVPESSGSVTLPIATEITPGAVKPGPGLLLGPDGTLSVDMATDEEFEALLDAAGNSGEGA